METAMVGEQLVGCVLGWFFPENVKNSQWVERESELWKLCLVLSVETHPGEGISSIRGAAGLATTRKPFPPRSPVQQELSALGSVSIQKGCSWFLFSYSSPLGTPTGVAYLSAGCAQGLSPLRSSVFSSRLVLRVVLGSVHGLFTGCVVRTWAMLLDLE